MTAPCKECQERKLGCHAECEKYAEFKERLKIGAAERQRIRDGEPVFTKNVLRQIWREMKTGRVRK